MTERREHPSRYAFIIGAMKCGTTNLFHVLGQHPQIAVCSAKEPNFFSHQEEYAKGVAFYRSLWDWRPGEHAVALEASTAYTKYPRFDRVAARIAQLDAHAKLIYIMRHPFERIESHIRQGLYQGFSRSLDERLGKDEIAWSRYATQIDQYMGRFPRESLLLFTLDEYKHNAPEVLQRICRHLDVDPDFVFDRPHMNRHDGSYYQRRKGINKVLRTRGLQTISRIVYHVISKLARLTIPGQSRQSLRQTLVEIERGRFRLNDEERRFVLEQLAPDLRRLQSVYGVDVERYWNLPL